jgi:hypothetical protein
MNVLDEPTFFGRTLANRFAVIVVALFTVCHANASEDTLKTLRSDHPRLLVSNETWDQLRVRRKSEPVLDQILKATESDAIKLLNEPVLTYKKEGKRLLRVSREAIRRIIDLAIASKTNADGDLFKKRAEVELLALANFSDWNPTHFLDVGEMTTALALGYDWLYAELKPETRRVIRTAILDKALKVGDDPKLPNTDWYHKEMNWNQVCLGGLALGALAIADEEPVESAKMLEQVRANIIYGLRSYAPEGIYPEGPSYWGYGTTYQILLNESLKSALGSDWGLSDSPGFRSTANYLVEMTGPTLKLFNYSDGGEPASLEPALYALAWEQNRPDLLYFQDRILQEGLKKDSFHRDRFFPLVAIFGKNFKKTSAPRIPLNWKGDGAQPLAVFRSDWKQDALFLAVKGGSASLNHAHMDAGSFVLDRDGVRWASDLGMQDYFSLESKNVDLWNRKQKSQRWDVFRIGPLSHNTLTIGSQPHLVSGQGKIIDFVNGSSPKVNLDLSSVFSGQATQVMRSFSIIKRRRIEIVDSIKGVPVGTVIRWNLTTQTKVTVHGATAKLEKEGKTLHLKLLEPAGIKWQVKNADPPPHDYDAGNPGVSLLSIDLVAPANGNLTIRVLTE